MVDANQSMTAAEAVRRAAAFGPLDLLWLEEPLPADDASGHARLAAATAVPIAVGESLYSIAQFRDHLHRGAASIVQPDVARAGGITPWLKVAHLAEAFTVEVCPHFPRELHVSLAAAVPSKTATRYLRKRPGSESTGTATPWTTAVRRETRNREHDTARPPGNGWPDGSSRNQISSTW